MIYFIADTHFGYANIIKYENRPFCNVEEINRVIIDRWNQTVSKEDTVYHLGDFFLTYTKKQMEIMNRLNGEIILIRGNHDC